MHLSPFLQALPLLAAPVAAAPKPWGHWHHGPYSAASTTSSVSQQNSDAPGMSQPPSSVTSSVAGFEQTPSAIISSAGPGPSANSPQSSVSSPQPSSGSVQPNSGSTEPSAANSTTGGLVFAHYMLISRPPSNDYATDMVAAKAMGIDAFAVNYGGFQTDYAQQNAWLTEFYNKAAANGMKAFLSIDTTIQPTITPDKILNLTQTFAKHPAQLVVDGQPLLTSFEISSPTSWNWKTDILSKVSPTPLFIACSLSDSASNTLTLRSSQGASGGLTWILPQLTADKQKTLDTQISQNKGSNKWLAAVAPWYFKRLSADMNWAHAQDDAIFVDRFAHLLSLDPRPDFIELVTWNDWGESHYIGPAPARCDSCYYGTLNHTAFQRLAKPFVTAFKTGATAPVVDGQEDEVFMFYRTQKASANDNSGLPLPRDAASLKDDVFVVGALKEPATVTLTTGPTTTVLSLGAGVQKTGVPFAFGAQALSGTVGGKQFKKTGPDVNETVVKVNDNIVIV